MSLSAQSVLLNVYPVKSLLHLFLWGELLQKLSDSNMMNVRETELDGVLIIEPKVFGDKRGYFVETYQRQRYADAGIDADFVQDNLSFSKKGTLRGLHYQHPHDQAKLVQVIQGEVFDVVVDIRRESPTFGKWIGQYLSDENKQQIFIPEGFAHGFCVLSDTALVSLQMQRFLCAGVRGRNTLVRSGCGN